MQGKYKTKNKKYSKGSKKLKITKAEDGLVIPKKVNQEDVTTQGITQGIEGAVSSIPLAGAFMALGKAGYHGLRQEDEYGVAKSDALAGASSVFAPHKTSIRAFKEGGIGKGLWSLTGVGTVLTAAQQNKEDRKKREELKAEEFREANAPNIRTDLTSFQAKQYSKGSNKLKTKVIEIEGKKTPEIHTDSNFNLKNLGTTPHSKGGNKVVAEEGDIVFPTQNSEKKYNEVMTAIMKKDKYKLKKEQNKLPEDKASKYKEGAKKIWVDGKQMLMTDAELKEYKANQKKQALQGLTTLKDNSGASLYGQPDKPLNLTLPSTSTKVSNENKGAANTTRAKEIAQSSTNKSGGKVASPNFPTSGKIDNPDAILNKYVGNKGWNVAVGRAGTGNIEQVKARKQDVKSAYNKESNDAARKGLLSGQFPVIQGKEQGNKDAAYNWPHYIDDKGVARQVYDEDLAQMKSNTIPGVTVTPKSEELMGSTQTLEAPVDKTKPKKQGSGLNTGLLEYTPTAYNLAQGLFGKTEKVKRKNYNPELERYVDTSANLRREINQGYKANVGNARNLSGGLASNMRANSQSAVNNKIQQVNSVDSNEYGKQLDVNNRNVDRINTGKLTNIDLFNKYEDLDAQNRAKKSEALASGLTSIGDIAGRDKLYKNNLQAKLIEGNAIQGAYNYGNGISTDGTQITGLNTDFRQGSSIPTNQYSSLDITKKPKKQSKGNKSIQVERRYKLKK